MLKIIFYLLLNPGVMFTLTWLITHAHAASVPPQVLTPAVKSLSPGVQSFTDALQQRQRAQQQGNADPQALVFVSLSVPEDGLKSLMREAGRFHIPVTLRGLVNNDMRQTASAVLQLVSDDKRGGVQIDPRAFRRWGVTAVPVLIVTCPGHHDRIAGTLSVTAALKKMAAQGDCAPVAQALLDTAGVP